MSFWQLVHGGKTSKKTRTSSLSFSLSSNVGDSFGNFLLHSAIPLAERVSPPRDRRRQSYLMTKPGCKYSYYGRIHMNREEEANRRGLFTDDGE